MNDSNHMTGLPGATGAGGGVPASAAEGSGLEQQVRRINDKLQLLVRQREVLLKENGKLKEEVRNLQQQYADHSVRLEHLQQQAEILKASKGEMDETEKRVLEKRLAQYIREIDRCIALLGE